MNSNNRRAEMRIDVRMPIRFRPITNPPSAEQSAESVNISEHGLLFFTNCPLRVGEEVRHSLAGGLGVAVFPEGTSTAGATVLPFHPGLLEPAAEVGAACQPVALRYETPSGSAEPSVAICWWGDMTFLPHVWRLMQLPRVTATLCWAGESVSGSDRKALAALLHGRVQAAFRPMTP